MSKRCVQILQLERGLPRIPIVAGNTSASNVATAIVGVTSFSTIESGASKNTTRTSRMTLRGSGALSPSRRTAAPKSSSPHRRPAPLQRIRQRHTSSGGRRRVSDPSRFTRSFAPSQRAGPAQHLIPHPVLVHLQFHLHADQLVPGLSHRTGKEACQHSHSNIKQQKDPKRQMGSRTAHSPTFTAEIEPGRAILQATNIPHTFTDPLALDDSLRRALEFSAQPTEIVRDFRLRRLGLLRKKAQELSQQSIKKIHGVKDATLRAYHMRTSSTRPLQLLGRMGMSRCGSTCWTKYIILIISFIPSCWKVFRCRDSKLPMSGPPWTLSSP